MKTLAFAFLFFVFTGAAQAADLVISGQVGSIHYYAVSTTKSLKIQLPWAVKIGLTDLGASAGHQRYYVNLYSEIDARLDKPEINELRSQYPGYKVDEAIPTQLQSIQVDLGDGNIVSIPAPPTSQSFFSQSWFLDSKSGAGIWAKWKAGNKPTVSIQAQVTVPVVIQGENFNLPLHQICPKTTDGATVETLLGQLVSSLEPIYMQLKSADMKQLVLSTAIESCVQMGDVSKINSISDVLKLPATAPNRVEDVQLTTDHVDRAIQSTSVSAEIETSEIK